jgi:isoprenylcysteine carboxyl methyltransferase (ICMT) family protein YpbQ
VRQSFTEKNLKGNFEMTETKKTPKRNDVTLAQLVEAGILKAGAVLTANYKGEKYSVRLLKNGAVKYGQGEYRSLSMAGRAILAEAGVEKPSVNGWVFFTAKVNGEAVTLASLRNGVQAE